MKWYVISHPSRGWYTGSEYEITKDGYKWVPHFAWSVTARDDRVERLYSQREIDRELNKMPKKVREKCTVQELKSR